MRGAGVVAVLALCALAETARAQSCGVIGPTSRKINVPAGWNSGPVPEYPDVWLFSAQDGSAQVSILPQAMGVCDQQSAKDNWAASARPAVFPQRFYPFWSSTVDQGYLTCRDWYGYHFEIKVHLSGAAVTDPRILEMTTAIADSFDYEVRCPGDPEVVTTTGGGGGMRTRAPWRLDFRLQFGGGHVFDAPPDFPAFAEGRISMIGRNRVFEVNPFGGAGIGFSGGAVYDLGFRAGFSFGEKRKRVSTVGSFGIVGVSGKRLPPTMNTGGRLEIEWPASRRWQLIASLDANWTATSIEVNGKKELTDFEFSPGAAVMFNRRRWLLGVDARKWGDAVLVGGFWGFRFRISE